MRFKSVGSRPMAGLVNHVITLPKTSPPGDVFLYVSIGRWESTDTTELATKAGAGWCSVWFVDPIGIAFFFYNSTITRVRDHQQPRILAETNAQKHNEI